MSALEVPLPPAQVDDAHLLPWVLLVLFVGFLYLGKRVLAGDKKCEERNAKLEAEFREEKKYTRSILVGCINESTQASRDLRKALAERDYIPADQGSDTVLIPPAAAKPKIQFPK
jgi:hypothetical protein